MVYFSLLPVLANLSNGNSYLPSMSANQANLLAIHQSAAAENSLEYSRSAVASKLCQLAGAGQIELDSLNDELESYNATNNDLRLANAAVNIRRIGNELRTDENSEKNYAALNSIYNMGLSSPNLLMMPGVMNMLRDPSSMVPSMSPYAMLNHQLSAHSPSASTNNLPDIETSPTTSTNSSASNAKETITCNSCILLPPNPGAPTPTTRERPKGKSYCCFLIKYKREKSFHLRFLFILIFLTHRMSNSFRGRSAGKYNRRHYSRGVRSMRRNNNAPIIEKEFLSHSICV